MARIAVTHLKSIGLARLAPAIQSRSLPSLRLTAGKPSAQPVTRLGGRPNLPKDIRWPVWQDGFPLSFIAQLDLATLPPVRGLPLPETGSLFFFYDADTQPWGFDPKDKACAQVIYVPAPLAAHRPRALHRDLDEEVRFKGLALTATLEMSLPNLGTGLLGEFKATRDEFDAYFKLIDPLSHPVHRIGGHADQIQGDLGLNAQLVSNGIYCGDGDWLKRGRKRGLLAGAADWRLLLQVDSEDRAGMMWGDGGRIYFMVHKDDLLRRCFDKVVLILQCT
jgi:uncharacterized protein YwqG